MELRIEPYQQPEQITFNYEELKQALIEKAAHYEAIVYTEDQIKNAKADRANLNRLKKALNDERLNREREYMTSFNAFKAQINEIISIIDKPCVVIDKQIKAYEDKQKEQKLEAILHLFNSYTKPEWLTPKAIFNDKWLNASCKMSTVEAEMQERLDRIETDLATLAEMPEFGFEATEEYKRSLDIQKAISEGKRLAEMAKRKAEAAAISTPPKPECHGKFTDTEKCTEEVGCQHSESCKNEAAANKQWISFRALLSVEQAVDLKQFFKSKNIDFEKI